MKVKYLLTLAAVCAASAADARAATYFKIADEFGTIQPAGPRVASSGNRFWTAEGSSFGNNSSTAPFRFYTADLVSQFDAQYGAGQWEVTNVNLVFSQSNAFFTAAGGVKLYWFENDSLAITNGQNESSDPGNFGSLPVSQLRYQAGANALDTTLSDGTTDANAIFGNVSLIDSYQFTSTGTAGDWPLDVLAPRDSEGNHVLINPETPGIYAGLPDYGIAAPVTNPTRPFRSDTLANFDDYSARVESSLDITPIAADLMAGSSALSFMLVADAGTAATYKGNPFGGDYPARIYIEVSELSVPELEGDHNADGKVDALDYVVWRMDPANHGDDPGGYDAWSANYGEASGGGSSSIAVPEPSSAVLVMLILGAAASRRMRKQ